MELKRNGSQPSAKGPAENFAGNELNEQRAAIKQTRSP